ncbi:MAG TPA: metallopeptidase TldD-related protein [Terracidiphilus sp.]|nr:metallopeptidase TldD-related protein [Terracidiphilus sp.]
MKRSIALLALCTTLVAPLCAAQATRADAEKDPVLAAMLTELDRSMSHLQLTGFQKPYFIQYRIEDVDNFQADASFGATTGIDRAHQRIARITVRVGDYKTDSSGGRGDSALELTSLDADPIALRSALWAGTDRAYKAALDSYAQKQAALKQVQTPPQADDFSHEKPVISLAPPATLQLDEQSWIARVAKSSGLYRTDPSLRAGEPDVQTCAGTFSARVTTTWLVNSEGTIVRKTASEYQQAFATSTQAADGMKIERSFASSGPTLASLDSEDKFNKHAVEEIASLTTLRNAPVVEEEYHGPVLLSADAATDTLASVIGSGVTASRPPLGTEARTTGPFASSLHTRVLPEDFTAVDDPGLTTYNGQALIGAYSIDDEGVPAQPVQLITEGKLVNYLIGRDPIRDFPQSNGHGRAGITGPPHSSAGVLKFTASDGKTDADLNQQLLALAKDRGQSVYYVETLGGPLVPRLLYKVSPDGKRELVRGAVLDDLDQRALRSSILAAGKDLWVANYFGDIPQSVIGPALLLDDVTIKRANEKNDKLPFYPPPN